LHWCGAPEAGRSGSSVTEQFLHGLRAVRAVQVPLDSRIVHVLSAYIERGIGERVRKCYRFISLGGPDRVPPLLENF
jgi:hypothetical protein